MAMPSLPDYSSNPGTVRHVSVRRLLDSGTEIADITVNGTTTKLLAPNASPGGFAFDFASAQLKPLVMTYNANVGKTTFRRATITLPDKNNFCVFPVAGKASAARENFTDTSYSFPGQVASINYLAFEQKTSDGSTWINTEAFSLTPSSSDDDNVDVTPITAEQVTYYSGTTGNTSGHVDMTLSKMRYFKAVDRKANISVPFYPFSSPVIYRPGSTIGVKLDFSASVDASAGLTKSQVFFIGLLIIPMK